MTQEKNYNDRKIDMKVWRRLIAYALRTKGRVIRTMLVLLGVAAVDLIYPLMTRYAINHFIYPGVTEGIGLFAAGYMALVVAQSAGVFLFVKGACRLDRDISYAIRQEAFTKLQQLSFSFYDTTSVGWLMARMGSDVARISEMIAWSVVDLMWAATFALGVVGVLLWLNWKLGLLVLVVTPVLAVLCIYFQRRILVEQRIVRQTNSRITGAFNEGVMGAVTTKTLVRENAAQGEFGQLTQEMYRSSVHAASLSALFMPLVVNLGAISTALALCVGGNMALAAVIDIGTLAAFITYTTQLFDPIQQLAGILAEMQSAQASAERVLDLLDTQPDVKDSPAVVEQYGDLFEGKTENWPPIAGKVEFRDVTFRYKTGETVLKHFNLTVKPGENIALVGETGAGKSTIVNLVCRFYEPSEGQILIDDVDYRQRSQLWWDVPVADSFDLLKDIYRIDPALYRKNRDELTELLDLSQLLRTPARQLSLGQRMRCEIAASLLHSPKVLFLDEPTIGLDAVSKLAVRSFIRRLNETRRTTVILTTHDMQDIEALASRILLIGKGKILMDGTLDDIRRGGESIDETLAALYQQYEI